MNNASGFSLAKICLACCLALFIWGLSGIGQAYNYQNNEYSFRIECPQEPRNIFPVKNAADKGVAMDLSAHDDELYVWMVQIRKEDFINTKKLSTEEIQNLLTELRRSDYGEQICDSAELVDVGRYQGVLLLLHDKEDLMAISMFSTEKGTYLVTLMGSMKDRRAFEKNLAVYRRGLSTFATL